MKRLSVDLHEVFAVNGGKYVQCVYMREPGLIPMGKSRTRCPKCGAVVTPEENVTTTQPGEVRL